MSRGSPSDVPQRGKPAFDFPHSTSKPRVPDSATRRRWDRTTRCVGPAASRSGAACEASAAVGRQKGGEGQRSCSAKPSFSRGSSTPTSFASSTQIRCRTTAAHSGFHHGVRRGREPGAVWHSHGRRLVPIDTVVDVISQVCRGLAVAHDEKPPIIQRDKKPQNILVGYDANGLSW